MKGGKIKKQKKAIYSNPSNQNSSNTVGSKGGNQNTGLKDPSRPMINGVSLQKPW
jgi:hypothetical protein